MLTAEQQVQLHRSRPGELLATQLRQWPEAEWPMCLALIEQGARQAADLEVLREVRAYRKRQHPRRS
jgi:hypothetical protein